MFQANQEIGVYTLIRQIGRGGFGEVWLAERRTEILTTQFAIKLPHREQVDLEAIRQEAQLWAKASGHPNVLPIIEANIYDGRIVIVSEFAPDGSLEEKIHRNELLPVKQTIETVIGILNGLDFLHSRNIIHRDIKPANILLQGETPRLADFGISRVIKTTVLSTSVVGTPKYMAPEAFDGKRSVETDIWSVGVMLYQMLSKNLPFPQENPTELMYAIVFKDPEPMPESVPADLRKIVQKALSKLPENRFQSALEMRDELQRAWLHISHPTFAPTEILPKPVIKDEKLTNEDNSIVTVITKTEIPPTIEESKDFTPAPLVDKTIRQNQLETNRSAKDNPPPPTAEQATEITIKRPRGFHWGFYLLPFPIDFITRFVTINFAENLGLGRNPVELILFSVLPMEVLVFAIFGALFGYFFPQGTWKWGILLNVVFLFIAILAAPFNQTAASLILVSVTTVTAGLTSLIASYLSPRKPAADPAQVPEEWTTRRILRWVFYFVAPVTGFLAFFSAEKAGLEMAAPISDFFAGREASHRYSYYFTIPLLSFIFLGNIGILLGYIFPEEKWKWGLRLNILNLILLVYSLLAGIDEGESLFFNEMILLFSFLLFFGCLSSYLGSRLRLRREVEASASSPEKWTLERVMRWMFYFLAPGIGLFNHLVLFPLAIRLVHFLSDGDIPELSIMLLVQILLGVIFFGYHGAVLGYIFPQEKWRWGWWLNLINLIWMIRLTIARNGTGSSYIYYLYDSNLEILLDIILFLSLLLAPCLTSYLASRLATSKSGVQV